VTSLNLAARAGRWSAAHWKTAVAVWVAFVVVAIGLGTTLDIKQLGVGLAVAVFIDATLIRGVLLPAAMKLLGDWNWYLPRWLEWLPRLSAEPKLREDIPDAPPVTVA
jgi:uncharacterized membrane protein YdfJ with MMPL/SSD domain